MTTLVASAYRQLYPAQKAFVDAYVAQVERDAERRNERISNALFRTIPADVVEASGGMLDNGIVRAAIAERINERAACEEFTWQRWLKEVASIAFSTVNNYMEVGDDGVPEVNFAPATPEAMAAVKSIEVEESGDPFGRSRKKKVKFQLHDKMTALKMMQEFYITVMQDNPHMMQPARDVTISAANVPQLPAAATVEQAADAYARMIDG